MKKHLSPRLLTVPALSLLLAGSAIAAADGSLFNSSTTVSSTDSKQALTGMVAPSKIVTLIAPVDGVLRAMPAHEGDIVTEGQTLAEMDDGVQRVVVEGAKLKAQDESAVKKADLLIQDAKLELDKVTSLQASNAAGDWEVRKAKLQLDQAHVAYEGAVAEHGMAVANQKLEEERLQRFVLKAPFSGMVIKRSTEAGATLTHTDQVVQVAQLDTLEAQMNLPIELYGKVAVGKEYKLAADTPVNATLTAKMKTIDPIIDTASKTFRCVLTIENSKLTLPAGFTVTLMLDAK